MTTYTADAGEVAIHARILSAGVEDIVDLRADALFMEVMYWPNTGTDPVYVRANSGTSAAALPAGDGGSVCQVLLPGQTLKFDSPGDSTRVRLICAGAATYSVSEA